jgi:hypothetical protein
MQDLNDRQAQLFVGLCRLIAAYQPPEIQRPTDQDVEEAVAALASTLETATKGVIYEHKAATGAAQRLASELRPALKDALEGGGTSAERDAAVSLRHLERMVNTTSRSDEPGSTRTFLDLLVRVLGRPAGPEANEPRLIVP